MQWLAKTIFVFLLFPFSGNAEKNCDTLFISYQAKTIFTTSLDSLGFDSSKVACRFHSPEGFLFQGEDGYYQLAFRDGKKWRSWRTNFSDVEFGKIFCNWKDVDGKGKSELVIWELRVFGHHAATHAEESTTYTVHIWNIQTATCLLEYTYKSSEWNEDVDYMETDSVTKQLIIPPYETDEFSQLSISTKAISFHVVRNVHDTTRVMVTEDENGDLMPYDSSQDCSPAEGIYVYQNGCWTRKHSPMKTHAPALLPPDFHPYWEW